MKEPSGEMNASRPKKPVNRRLFLKLGGAGVAIGAAALLPRQIIDASAQSSGQAGTPETPQEKERREFLERFEFNATPDQQRITLKLTEAGRKALSDPSLGFSPNNEQLANVTVWLLEEKQRAGQLDIPIDPAGVNPRTIADYLAQTYGPQPGKDPNRSFLVEVKQGERSVYQFNPLSGTAWAQFDIPFSVLQPQQESAAAQPAGSESQPGPPVEPTPDPTNVAQWLEDIQRGNATATPNVSGGTPMPDQKTTALPPVGVSNSSLRRIIAYACGIPLAAVSALVGIYKWARRGEKHIYYKPEKGDELGQVEAGGEIGEPNPVTGGIAASMAQPAAGFYPSDTIFNPVETGFQGKPQQPLSLDNTPGEKLGLRAPAPSSPTVETETNVITYGEPDPIVSAAATPRALPETPSSAPSSKRVPDRQNFLPPDVSNPTPSWEQVPKKRYSTSQLIRDAEQRHARHPGGLPRALAFWEKWIKDNPDQVIEDRPSSERVVESQ